MGDWDFYLKNILVLEMQQKKNKIAHEWYLKNNMASKTERKKITLDPHDGNDYNFPC